MTQHVLEFQGWRRLKPAHKDDLAAAFLFTLRPAGARDRGERPDPSQTFWTEVHLARDLASRGRWPELSREQKVRAMFRFAVESIVDARRPLREAPMFWTPSSPLGDGPPWDLEEVSFPRASPVLFEGPLGEPPSARQARKAAGLPR